MKIAFVYNRFSLNGKIFQLDQLWDNPAGLTGSESSCFFYAIEMANLGHEVSFYSSFDKEYNTWKNIKIYDVDKLKSNAIKYDVIYSWNEPEVFRNLKTNALKVVNQQLNDFNYCNPGYNDLVDLYTSPSHTHSWMLYQEWNVPLNKFVIIPNGVNINRFPEIERIPGRVVYISSPDRGLHWLLMGWEKIKKSVPHANLRIYYEIERWYSHMSEWSYYMENKTLIELHHRANYIKYALDKLSDLDVKHEGSNSYNKMSQNLRSAEVFCFPADLVIWSEGFSVSTLEACAAGTCPIVSDTNALGEIYGSGAWVLPSPIKDHFDKYIDATIEGLTNKKLREEKAHKAHEFAKQYDYKLLTLKLEKVLKDKL